MLWFPSPLHLPKWIPTDVKPLKLLKILDWGSPVIWYLVTNLPRVWAQVPHLFSSQLAKSLCRSFTQLILQNFTWNTMIYVKEWRGHLSHMHCFEKNEPKILVFLGKCFYMRLSTWNWSTFYWGTTSVHKPPLAVSLKVGAPPGSWQYNIT